MLINEYVALELHKQRIQQDEKVEGNRTLAEIIAEYKTTRRENATRKPRNK